MIHWNVGVMAGGVACGYRPCRRRHILGDAAHATAGSQYSGEHQDQNQYLSKRLHVATRWNFKSAHFTSFANGDQDKKHFGGTRMPGGLLLLEIKDEISPRGLVCASFRIDEESLNIG
jgi:hypothetical protein